ncbi:MAG TPA: glycine cleavage T C-terminal barrel domain-containing protein [Phycisphaerae bacterium]|nr:glycine cleavage T C-terminal barrel domain-containing protein [Phycisphaerae bacterium]
MPNPPEIQQQYRAAMTAGGVYARADRGLIEVRGKDRATWLNNLVTNVVKTLQPGEGNYAFATSVKGRAVFDMNILILDDRLWLDVDRRQIETATKHLERYVITEDVQLADVSSTVERHAVMGPRAGDAGGRLGLGNFSPMSQLQHVAGRIGASEARFVRHDFAGVPAFEIIVCGEDRAAARAALDALAGELHLATLSAATVQILRMEAGIPASVDDIDEEVVPPETGQVERGISYHKGCYLGQEVIERMRSHGILARKLAGLRVSGEAIIERGAEILSNSTVVGRVTSSCFSEAMGAVLCLGYVKSALAKVGTPVRVVVSGDEFSGEVVPLPVNA